jgi:hypothetical protein
MEKKIVRQIGKSLFSFKIPAHSVVRLTNKKTGGWVSSRL